MMTIMERARRCVATRPPAIEGQGGHSTTFGVACLLVHGFGLSPEEAMPIMQEYNATCQPPWSERDLQHKLTSVLSIGHATPRGHMVDPATEKGEVGSYQSPALSREKAKKEYDPEALKRVQRPDWKVDGKWLRERSPIDPRTVTIDQYLDALYKPDEMIMIFCGLRGTGDYMRWIGRGTYRLGKTPGVKAVPVDRLPDGSDEGMSFLMQPVNGKWYPVSGKTTMSRRTRKSVTRFPYMLLESDKAPHDLWLNCIAQVKLPIVSITTSGGRSLHALLRVECETKEEWDDCALIAASVLTTVGCDGQAMQAVVYPRLPGKMRGGKMYKGKFEPFPEGPRKQHLLYFNPGAICRSIGEGLIFERK